MNSRIILSKLEKLNKLEYIFVFIAFFWGVALVFIIPPLQVPDEGAHLIRAWGVSSLKLNCDNKSRIETPQNIGDLLVTLNHQKIDSGIYPDSETRKRLDEKIDTRKDKYFSQFCAYSPLSYVPQSLGIIAARVFDSSVLKTIQFGRITNLLISILLIFWAIRLMPFGKVIFLFTGLLPMAMQQFSSLSGDAFHFSGLLFFSALLLNFSQKEKLKEWHLVILTVSSVVFVHTKPGYIGLLLLFLLLRRHQFRFKKNHLFFLGIVLIANIIMAFALVSYVDTKNFPRPNEFVSPEKQIALIKNHPTVFISAISQELEKNSVTYLTEMIGQLGPLSVALPAFLYLLILFSLMFLLTSNQERVALTVFQRLILFSSSAIVIFSIFFSEYIFWTAPGLNNIGGIQGRYFIPVFPLIILSVYKFHLNRFWRSLFILAIFLIISLSTILSLKSHYYKKHLFTIPENCNTYSGMNEVLVKNNNITEKDDKLNFDSKKESEIKFDMNNVCGVTFKTSRDVKIGLDYVFKPDNQDAPIVRKESVASTREVILNFDLIKKNDRKGVWEADMTITSSEPFEIFDAKTYK